MLGLGEVGKELTDHDLSHPMGLACNSPNHFMVQKPEFSVGNGSFNPQVLLDFPSTFNPPSWDKVVLGSLK